MLLRFALAFSFIKDLSMFECMKQESVAVLGHILDFLGGIEEGSYVSIRSRLPERYRRENDYA